MKQKDKEKQKQKLVPKKLKQILNKNKTKPIEIRTKVNKMKKIQIGKTHSMENINNPKNTSRKKSSKQQKIFNNSMEELDYLNFSEIDIDFYKKNSSFEEDIFNPKYYIKNKKEEKKQIVQNRYNMIDTSFDTIKSAYIKTDSGDDYIDANKNKLLKTPSTICNYYDKSEISSERKNKNNTNVNSINKNNKNEKEKENDIKNMKFKKLKNKSIQIPNNNITNYNQPISSNRTNRTKLPKTFSSSNIKLTQNNNNNNSNKKNTFYNNKKGNTTNNFMPGSKKKIKEEISSSILKKKNKEIKNNIYSKVKNQNNLMKNYLKSNIDKNKNNTINNVNKKKSFSTKNYTGVGNVSSQILQNKKGFNNCNFTYNNDLSNYMNKKTNIQNLLKSLKEQKENIKNINNNITYKESPIQEDIIPQKQQKPIMLCLDKSKFSLYFVTSTNSNSDKKNLTNSKKKDIEKNNDYLNLKINNNIAEENYNNYTGRNIQNSFNSKKKDIIVKRKKLNKTNTNINPFTKTINSNININTNTNTTFTNYANDKPIIKVNLKKHIKSSSELIKFINVDIKNKNNKNPKNNKSFLSTCTRASINTSQVVNELFNKKKILKSPSQINNNTLKTSKTMKDINLNKTKTTPKYNKINKKENFSTVEKKNKNYVGSNQKGYYSIKYELNLKNNNNSNICKSKNKNKLIKNSFKPKTQSDIKVSRYKIKEDENSKKSNKENKDNNNEYGMDKRVKQKLLDRMNKVSKNNYGYIWGGKKTDPEIFYDIMKSPNKDFLLGNNFYYNNKIISNENSKNEERDFDKRDNNDKRNQKEITVIKEYKASRITNTYI